MPTGAENAKQAAAAVQPSGAQACIMVLAPNSGAAFVRDVRRKGAGIPIHGLSYVPADLVVAKAVEGALRGLRLDFGGYTIDYTDGSNVGSSKVDIGVIDRQGRLRY